MTGGVDYSQDVRDHTLPSPLTEAWDHAGSAWDSVKHGGQALSNAADHAPKFFGYAAFGLAALGSFLVTKALWDSGMRNSNNDSWSGKAFGWILALGMAAAVGTAAFEVVANKGAEKRAQEDAEAHDRLGAQFRRASAEEHGQAGPAVQPFEPGVGKRSAAPTMPFPGAMPLPGMR